ncbi:penicillin-binding transpeptidase domain-containing protein [Phnomibacter ginsenosidimutans]|uniref:beta-lactamase n=1 Tax=Phnomibacter ginsenosidimutans TaxID=2676868 RepID=A0A6I6G9N8_9BACT|nr:penicillin-binding transpeptidase domain-containing protein [Phnomibacter ginsenosidimutans]QGW29516.1 class D beta-lactamase [Phnomibacter ginsenosidimutans]
MMTRVFPAMAIVASLWMTACSTNNITQENELKKYFDSAKVEGCFGMFDNGQGQFTIYNMPRYRDSAYTPASTFKIFNSLVALGTGRIFSDTVVVPWDGVVRTSPSGDTMTDWNKDMNMREAFAVSNVGFYQEMARRIGRDTMQKMLDSVGYGNKKIGASIDRFWLDNSLKITPDEELGLVKRLYFKQLPFQNREQEIVKDLMIREKTDKYTLAYKTGWGTTEKGNQLGWLVGWIEENNHPYFFVLNIESPDPKVDFKTIRLSILKSILKEKGFFEGRK